MRSGTRGAGRNSTHQVGGGDIFLVTQDALEHSFGFSGESDTLEPRATRGQSGNELNRRNFGKSPPSESSTPPASPTGLDGRPSRQSVVQRRCRVASHVSVGASKPTGPSIGLSPDDRSRHNFCKGSSRLQEAKKRQTTDTKHGHRTAQLGDAAYCRPLTNVRTLLPSPAKPPAVARAISTSRGPPFLHGLPGSSPPPPRPRANEGRLPKDNDSGNLVLCRRRRAGPSLQSRPVAAVVAAAVSSSPSRWPRPLRPWLAGAASLPPRLLSGCTFVCDVSSTCLGTRPGRWPSLAGLSACCRAGNTGQCCTGHTRALLAQWRRVVVSVCMYFVCSM